MSERTLTAEQMDLLRDLRDIYYFAPEDPSERAEEISRYWKDLEATGLSVAEIDALTEMR